MTHHIAVFNCLRSGHQRRPVVAAMFQILMCLSDAAASRRFRCLAPLIPGCRVGWAGFHEAWVVIPVRGAVEAGQLGAQAFRQVIAVVRRPTRGHLLERRSRRRLPPRMSRARVTAGPGTGPDQTYGGTDGWDQTDQCASTGRSVIQDAPRVSAA